MIGPVVPTQTAAPPRALSSDRPMSGQSDRLAAAAQAFEAAFIAEMLGHAGLGDPPEGMNGGVGEAAFSDFLAREYAEEIARTRPLGIGARLVAAMSGEAE